MQENAIYSVISPEGCAAILWRDAGEAKKAAAAFKPDAAPLPRARRDRRDRPRAAGRRARPTRRGRRGCSARRSGGARRARGRARRRAAGASGARKFRAHGRLRLSERLPRGFPQYPQGFPRSAEHASRPVSTGLERQPPVGGEARHGACRDDCSTRRSDRVGQPVAHGEPRRVPAQARPEEDAGAVRRRGTKRGESADLRRPAPRRAAAPLRLPARARRRARELGGAEGRAARARRSSTSPSTSRTTRSSTRPSRARSRRASTAPARSRSGTTARTSSSRRSRTAA